MPFIRIWIHAVWATKNRAPILMAGVRQGIFAHINENARLKNIYTDTVNGQIDDVHCLISLKAKQDIATVIQL
jgi:REP element-mobilizing transposase RayT